jgi:hypothetical protein
MGPENQAKPPLKCRHFNERERRGSNPLWAPDRDSELIRGPGQRKQLCFDRRTQRETSSDPSAAQDVAYSI